MNTVGGIVEVTKEVEVHTSRLVLYIMLIYHNDSIVIFIYVFVVEI